MLKNNERINDLLAWYGNLLTDNQLDIMQVYYGEDLSLAEIAENNGVSRAAIHDTIKRSEDLLENYEKKLQVVSKYKQRIKRYEQLKALNNEEVLKIVEQLEKIE